MALDLMSLAAKLGIDDKEYKQGIADAEKTFTGFGDKLKKGVANVAKVTAAAADAGAAAFGAVTTAVVKGTSEVAAFGDKIDKASQKLGISAKAYQEWDAVLQHSGTSIDSMGIGMKTLSNAAATGSDAFKKLGISQKKAAKMSREELFSKTITALQGVKDANKRAQLAQELFGRSAMELGPLLNTSAEDTQAMKDQVNALGGVLSDDAVKASATFQDTLQDMTTAMDGVKRGVFASFLPSMTQIMQGITDVFSGKGTSNIKNGVKAFVANMNNTLPSLLKKGLKIGKAVGSAVISAIPSVIKQVTGAVSKFFTTAKNVLLTNGVQKMALFINELITGGADKSFGPAQQRIQGRLTKLFENIFKLGGAIADKAKALWTDTLQPMLQNLVDFLVNKALPVVNKVLSFIVDNIDTIVPVITGAVGAIVALEIAKKITYFSGVIQGLFNVIKAHPFAIIIGIIAAVIGYVVHLYQTNEEARDKINAAFEAIKSFWEDTLKPAFQDIWDYVVNTLVPDIKKAWQEDIQPAIENAFNAIKGFWNDTLKPAFEDIYTYVVETLIPALVEWWDTKFKPTVETVFTAVAGFWNDTLKPAMEDIYNYIVTDLIPTLIVWWEYHLQPAIEGTFTAIKGFWEETLKPALEDIYTYVTETLIPTLIEWWDTKLKPTIETVFTAIAGFWNDTLKPAFEEIYTYVTETLIPTLQEKWEAIQPIIENVFTSIKTFWEETAQPALQAFWDFINDKVVPIMQTLGDKFTEIWVKYLKPVAVWVTDSLIVAWQGLKDQLSNLVDFISKMFSKDWKGAWDALVNMVKTPFEKLGEILKKPINAVIGLLNSMLSKVQGAINKMINGINDKLHLHFDGVEIGWPIYKTVAAFDWSPNIPTVNWDGIPLLARGGIVSNGGSAIVGEYQPEFLQMINGKAVVTPLNRGRFPGGGGQEVVVPRNQSRDLTVILELDRQQMGKMVYRLNNEETQRVGVRLAKGGAY